MINNPIFRVFMAVLLPVAVMVSCSKEEVKQTMDTQISLRVDVATPESADIRVSHSGAADQVWFYTCTDNLTAAASEILSAEIAKTLEFYGEIPAYVGRNKSIPVVNLKARTEYRFLAAFISKSGKLISNVSDLRFCTERDPEVFYPREDWSIKRLPKRTMVKKVEKDNFQCVVTDTTETYVPFIIPKAKYEGYNGSFKACFDDFVATSQANHVRWRTAIKYKSFLYEQDRLLSGDYVYFMLGIDADGNLTGYYSMTEDTIEQDPQSDEYKFWLGNWKWTGLDYKDNEVVYDVRIEAYENDYYYKLYGYEESTKGDYYPHVPSSWPIILYFEKYSGEVFIISQFIGEVEMDIYFYLFGNIEVDGTINYHGQENLNLARLIVTDGNTPRIVPCEYSLYDATGKNITGYWTSFSYAYMVNGLSSWGFAPFTADSKVISLNQIKLEKVSGN